ncbi:arsenate reductase (glutaredoxin) [Candidatus Thioglobus sp.]|jgi:arsenate reductase|nr:arsenate reductase (glutaredoxin) [Candidatus Thioglobus sp.]
MSTKIYHNARCSKSRATLAILEQNDVDFDVVNYLVNPPSESEIKSILKDLGINARDLLRKGEAKFKELGLSDKTLSEEHLIKSMIEFPILIERPIVRTEKGAVIGRPPENVNSIL